MAALRLTPRCTALFLLLAVAGGGWCQTQLLHPEPRTCRSQDNADDISALSREHRNEYPAGGVLMVLAEVPAGVFGSLEIDLCPEGDAEVDCLDRVPLQLADGSGTSYNLHNVPRTDKYEIPVILPDDITCPTCTLQLRVSTRHCADEDTCPHTEDTFCSDITVRDIKEPVRKAVGKGKRKGKLKYTGKIFKSVAPVAIGGLMPALGLGIPGMVPGGMAPPLGPKVHNTGYMPADHGRRR